jgi:ornithine cyclodeaminase
VQLRILSAPDIAALVAMPEAIDAMRDAFGQLSSGEARIPARAHLEADGTTVLFMPGALARPAVMGTKVVAVAPGNRTRGLPTIHAAMMLVDVATGRPTALLEGRHLTALRTGAASGLATDLLARPEASVLAVIGAGAQARSQVAAVRAVRPLTEVRVVSRTRASAERLARQLSGVGVHVCDDATTAVRGADIVVTATDSRDPVLADADIAAGTHINAIGSYTPAMRELPASLLARARVFVDQVASCLAEAGEIIAAVEAGSLDRAALTELGCVVSGSAVGRRDPDEVTVFKSVGSAAQDLAVAARALARAEARNVGVSVNLSEGSPTA